MKISQHSLSLVFILTFGMAASVNASTCYVASEAKTKDCPATTAQKSEHKKETKQAPASVGGTVHTDGVDTVGSVDTHEHSVKLKEHKPGATTPVVAQSAGKKSKPVPPPTSTGKKSKSSSFSATTGGTVQGTASTTGKYSKSKLLKYHAAQDHSVVQIRSQAATRSAAATSVSYKYLDPSQNRLNQLHVEYLHQDHPEYFNPDGSLTDLARQAGYGVIINTGLTDNTDIQVTRPVLYFFKAGDGQQVTQVSPDSLQTQGLILPNGLLSSEARQRGFLQVFGSPQNTRYFLTRNGQSQQLTDRQIKALQAGGQLGPDGTLTPSAIQHGFSAIVQQTPDPIVQPTPAPMQVQSPQLVPGTTPTVKAPDRLYYITHTDGVTRAWPARAISPIVLKPDGSLTQWALQHGYSTTPPVATPTPNAVKSPTLLSAQPPVQQVPQQITPQTPAPMQASSPNMVPQPQATPNLQTPPQNPPQQQVPVAMTVQAPNMVPQPQATPNLQAPPQNPPQQQVPVAMTVQAPNMVLPQPGQTQAPNQQTPQVAQVLPPTGQTIAAMPGTITHSLVPAASGTKLAHRIEPSQVEGQVDVARPHPDQQVELYHPVEAKIVRYEEARQMKDDSFHLMVLGFKEP